MFKIDNQERMAWIFHSLLIANLAFEGKVVNIWLAYLGLAYFYHANFKYITSKNSLIPFYKCSSGLWFSKPHTNNWGKFIYNKIWMNEEQVVAQLNANCNSSVQ